MTTNRIIAQIALSTRSAKGLHRVSNGHILKHLRGYAWMAHATNLQACGPAPGACPAVTARSRDQSLLRRFPKGKKPSTGVPAQTNRVRVTAKGYDLSSAVPALLMLWVAVRQFFRASLDPMGSVVERHRGPARKLLPITQAGCALWDLKDRVNVEGVSSFPTP